MTPYWNNLISLHRTRSFLAESRPSTELSAAEEKPAAAHSFMDWSLNTPSYSPEAAASAIRSLSSRM